MRKAVLLLASAALASLPAVLAAPASVTGSLLLPVDVEGSSIVSGEMPTLALRGDAGEVRISGRELQADVQHHVIREWGHYDPDDGLQVMPWGTSEDRPFRLANATVEVSDRTDRFYGFAFDTNLSMEGPAGGMLTVGSGPVSTTSSSSPSAPPAPGFTWRKTTLGHFQYEQPAGAVAVHAEVGQLLLTAPFKLYLQDARLDVADGGRVWGVPLYSRIEDRPGTVYDPLTDQWHGAGTHPEYIREFVILDVRAGALTISFDATPSVMRVIDPNIQVRGMARLPDFHGTVLLQEGMGNERHTVDGKAVELTGAFALRLATSSPAIRVPVTGDGDIVAVAYAGQRSEYDWTPVAVTGGALALAAIAFAAAKGQMGSWMAALVPAYARVAGPAILASPQRQHALDLVREQPGLSLGDLVELAGGSRTALLHHLGVLERNGYVVLIRDGRYRRCYPADVPADQRNRQAALSHETTRRIGEVVREQPGISQVDLARACGLGTSSVIWHTQRLIEAGLLVGERVGNRRRFYPAQGASLPVPI